MVACFSEYTLMQVWHKIDKKQEQILSQLEIPARSEIYDTPASTIIWLYERITGLHKILAKCCSTPHPSVR